MFRNCFALRFIGWVVLIVLVDQSQKVTSDQNHSVFKSSDREHPRPIYDRPITPGKLRAESKHRVPDADSVVGGEAFVERNSSERGGIEGRGSGPTASTGPHLNTKNRTGTLAYTSRLFASPRENRTRAASERRRRQMVEYYVDGPNGVIETRPSRKGQHHVALGQKSSDQAVAEQRDVRTASDKEDTAAKLEVRRPRVVNDDSGEAEDVYFSVAKQGQNREVLNLFRARSKRSADARAKLAGQNSRHHDVISGINDVKGPQGVKWPHVEYEDPGDTQRNTSQADFSHRTKNPPDFRNNSDKRTNTTALRHVIKSILEHVSVARFIEKVSTRSERRKRQILEYLVDSLNGRIDKRDTNAPQASTRDRSAKHRTVQRASAHEQVKELSRSSHENDKRKQRGLDRSNTGEEKGRSVENDSDDLEDVLQRRDENAADLDDNKQRRGADDDAVSKIRRRNYVINDAAEASDLDKRRAAYEEPEPSDDDIQEEDFYYVEDQGRLVKRDPGQKNEKLDYEFDDNVRTQDVEKSKRAAAMSEDDRKLLSKELVEIMIQEIHDRLQGKPGHPELQVRRRPLSLAESQETDKAENRGILTGFESAASSNDETKHYSGKSRNKRHVSHADPTDAGKRSPTGVEEDLDELEAVRRRETKSSNEDVGFLLGKRSPDNDQRLHLRKRSTPKEDADEQAEDLDMTKQLVAIVIDQAVKHLKNLAGSSGAGTQPQQSKWKEPQLQQSNWQEPLQKSVQDTEQGPPPLFKAMQAGPAEVTKPSAYWVIEPIPKAMAKQLVNTSDEHFHGGFRYRRVTYPPTLDRSKFAHDEAGKTQTRRRRSLTEDVKSVGTVGADFSSSAAKSRVGQRVFDGVDSAIFCRVIHRLVDLGKISRESFEKLLSNSTCFNFTAPYRNRFRRSPPFLLPIPEQCQSTEGGPECDGPAMPVVDPLTGGIADPRCEGLTYMGLYPSVFNFYRGQVASEIPLDAIYSYGGYIWGGIGTGIQAPAEPPKRNSVWGVLFSFRLPFRLWGLRFIESPPTLESVLSIVVYLQHFDDDAKNRWTAITEPGSTEPQIIPVTSPLIRFTEIHVVTGILIFLQEWRGGKPILPHPVFISCTESYEQNNPSELPIFRISSWKTLLEGIARDSMTYAMISNNL